MTRILLACFAALAVCFGVVSCDHGRQKTSATEANNRADAAEAKVISLQDALESERSRSAELNAVAEQYEKEKQDAQARAESVAAALRAGNLRLRHEVAALHTARLSGDTAAAAEPDPAVERGAELVSDAIGVGAACDARIEALIQAYEVNR
ncbi:DUF2514 family protein [Pseudoxanthomonas kalamensis]|uniref:DUF2514 family protein n=1 Tax=Pseudoxanthomonas kalamensis TaxID=289483 RepID=UPI001390E074|nr:DUF2514 family protein [Pseudoxanthomonas kalamensis]